MTEFKPELINRIAELLYDSEPVGLKETGQQWMYLDSTHPVKQYFMKRSLDLLNTGIFSTVWLEAVSAFLWCARQGNIIGATDYVIANNPFKLSDPIKCGAKNPRKSWVCQIDIGHAGSHKTFINGETYDWQMEY